jgi:hypothetical protein
MREKDVDPGKIAVVGPVFMDALNNYADKLRKQRDGVEAA